MRKPQRLECMYIDFDGFFASVEEQARPALRGRAIGVIPFEHATATIVIAANAKAKRFGVKTGTDVVEARRLCPEIALVPQSPDLYARAHHKLILEIESVLPIDVVCSIDELACTLKAEDQADPHQLARRIKDRIRDRVGPYVTCSIGMAPNRHLAKIASDMNKPDGLTILYPDDLPGPLLDLELDDLPGIGRQMQRRLNAAGIWSLSDLWDTQPKQLRALWGNVNGERFWYALHGYAVQAEATQKSMFGHGRVLPPDRRGYDDASDYSRLLTIKAARRMRRERFLARRFGLWLMMKDDRWSGEMPLAESNDDHSSLHALEQLWQRARANLPPGLRVVRVHVAHYDLVPEGHRQLDLLTPETHQSERWRKISTIIDQVNAKYAATVISQGVWAPPPGGYAGAKIAFSRIPDIEDGW
ncbi:MULTISPECIES: hypothetical protein [unclassified Iodidimonas]|uniref:Y-family DNA polymerase n=1 Tax=unclassified Iodidimonas TaxID=2626145 RepID=UPI002482396F|nr:MULTISPECIES: hypothetical protein [unclassified Iodidimonas]